MKINTVKTEASLGTCSFKRKDFTFTLTDPNDERVNEMVKVSVIVKQDISVDHKFYPIDCRIINYASEWIWSSHSCTMELAELQSVIGSLLKEIPLDLSDKELISLAASIFFDVLRGLKEDDINIELNRGCINVRDLFPVDWGVE